MAAEAEHVRGALADHRSDLAEMRAEVESMRDGLNERLATAGRALKKLSLERTDLQKESNMLRASLADKARVEAELRAQLSTAKRRNDEESEASATTSTAAAAAVDLLNDANAEVARLKAEMAEVKNAAAIAEARASATAAVTGSSSGGSLSDRAAQMSLKVRRRRRGRHPSSIIAPRGLKTRRAVRGLAWAGPRTILRLQHVPENSTTRHGTESEVTCEVVCGRLGSRDVSFPGFHASRAHDGGALCYLKHVNSNAACHLGLYAAARGLPVHV